MNRPCSATTQLPFGHHQYHAPTIRSPKLRRPPPILQFCNEGGKSDNLCTSCINPKSHCHPFRYSLPQADRILYHVHSDVVRPFQTSTPSGNHYFVTFINKFSRSTRFYLIKYKADVFDKFWEFISEAERYTGNCLCVLKCDRGGE